MTVATGADLACFGYSGNLAHAHLAAVTSSQAIQAAYVAGTTHYAVTGSIPHRHTDPDLIMEAPS